MPCVRLRLPDPVYPLLCSLLFTVLTHMHQQPADITALRWLNKQSREYACRLPSYRGAFGHSTRVSPRVGPLPHQSPRPRLPLGRAARGVLRGNRVHAASTEPYDVPASDSGFLTQCGPPSPLFIIPTHMCL
ncbi:hypothetical protein GGX14DRAFT_406333 [Mycena pura]|uniref:Uncharacterized protein n=1 Tax=Mycena pura TaxID=153505 RepID=A0AAD6USC6_9AGAR|nr:hypothetical protein GGX14DRAFT_406333 [Mycena pura]